jgi:hypothetical protein
MENYVISIDSVFRNHYHFPDAENFTYYLPDELKNIGYIRISSVELPKYYPSFTENKKNISFEILINDSGTLVGETITLDSGNYQTLSDLVDNINDKLLESDLSSIYGLDISASIIDVNGISYLKLEDSSGTDFILNFSSENHPYKYLENNKTKTTVSLNDLSYNLVNLGKYTNQSIISNDSKLEFPSRENYNVKNPPLGYYLGFRNKVYSGASSYTSEAPMVLNREKYLYIKINNYGKLYTNHGDTEYLAKVIFDQNNTHYYDDESNRVSKRFFFSNPVDIKEMKISLHDAYGEIIDLTNQDYSMTVELGVIQSSDLRNRYQKAFP